MSKYLRSDDKEKDMLYRLKGPLPKDDPDLVAYVGQYYLHPPSDEPYNLSITDDPTYKNFSKQGNWKYIHLYVEKLFKDEVPGFFIEAGALDGEFQSNSLWLEKEMGWTGLLVEPDKGSFRHLQSKHRKAWTTNTCISNRPYPKETIHVSLDFIENKNIKKVPWNHHSNSHELGVTVKMMNEAFLLASERTYSVIQCFPLNTYLLALNITTIDFMTLDIQGSEKDVLRNLNWDDIKIRMMIVEIVEKVMDEEFLDFMESRGYVLVNKNIATTVTDYIYVRTDERVLLEKSWGIKVGYPSEHPKVNSIVDLSSHKLNIQTTRQAPKDKLPNEPSD
ncbi:hypothetical protein SK128_015313 [Halocaridina rubra]|uniref:Methyltransferase FkbM domain-containing protein n=1 Tax=Halocaridina rubra TaxID=373956 RepID=A0AAN9A748_HALRR